MENKSEFEPKLTNNGLRSKIRYLRENKSIVGVLSKTIPQILMLSLTIAGEKLLARDQSQFVKKSTKEIPPVSMKKHSSKKISYEDEVDKSEDMGLVESVVYLIMDAVQMDYDEVSDKQNEVMQNVARKIISKVQYG